jgi:protein-tyrosine-phosphatase
VRESSKKRVLFVCVENSNRSQMAEAFARMHGGAAAEADSAASRPSGRVNPRAARFMAERDTTSPRTRRSPSMRSTGPGLSTKNPR